MIPVRFRAAACATVLAAVVWAHVVGQESPQRPTFRTGIDVTQFDVTVLDRDRMPVTGLTAADFRVTVDGKPARVVDVTPVDIPSPEPLTAPWLTDVAPDVVTNADLTRRIVIIVIDDALTGYSPSIGRDPWIGQTGRRIAHDAVLGLGPNDIAAVVFTYLGRNQNFTTDRAKLLHAVDTYVPQSGGAGGTPMGCLYRGRSGCTLDTLEHVVDALPTSPPYRKVIVFVSQGLGGIPGFSADAWSAEEARAADRDVPIPQLSDVMQIFAKLQRANATVYAYSPGGLQITASRAEESLRSFAEATGGRAVLNTNGPWEGVPQMLRETSSYYLVAFETPQLDGRFHRVDVSVARPDADVRTRAGYVAARADGSTGPIPKKGAPELTNLERATVNGFPRSDLPLMATATARYQRGQADAVVQIAMALPATSFADARRANLQATAYDRNFRTKASATQTIQLTGATTGLAEARTALRLPPGRYEIRVAGEAGGRTGSVFFDIEIPKPGSSPLWLSLPAVALGPGDPGTVPLTVRRAFGAGDRPRLILQVVQGGHAPAADVTADLTITDTIGRVVTTEGMTWAAGRFGAARMADVAVDLPLAALQSGEYLATVTAKLGTETATALLRFKRQ